MQQTIDGFGCNIDSEAHNRATLSTVEQVDATRVIEYLFCQVNCLMFLQFDRVSKLLDGLKLGANCKVAMSTFRATLDVESTKLMLKDDHTVQLVLQFGFALYRGEDLITLQALYFEDRNHRAGCFW